MVSSMGLTTMPWRFSTSMSYLRFWPILRMDGSSSSGFSTAMASASGTWPSTSTPPNNPPPVALCCSGT